MLIGKQIILYTLFVVISSPSFAGWKDQQPADSDVHKELWAEAKRLNEQALKDLALCESFKSQHAPYVMCIENFANPTIYGEKAHYRIDDTVAMLKKATDNDTFDLVNLGGMYYNSGDQIKAFEYFSLAATRGSEQGQYNVGYFYRYGLGGVKSDMQKALGYFTTSALAGDRKAKYQIADMYVSEEIPRDPSLVLRFLRESAEAGDKKAIAALGRMFADGKMVPQNDVLALALFYDYGDGSYSVTNERAEIYNRMTAKQRWEATVLSSHRAAIYALLDR